MTSAKEKTPKLFGYTLEEVLIGHIVYLAFKRKESPEAVFAEAIVKGTPALRIANKQIEDFSARSTTPLDRFLINTARTHFKDVIESGLEEGLNAIDEERDA